MDSNSTPKPSINWRERQVSAEERDRGAALLREQLSCVPFYKKRAEAAKARTGDEMAYWRDLQGSMVNWHLILEESLRAEKEPPAA